jgi:hypothetical protein
VEQFSPRYRLVGPARNENYMSLISALDALLEWVRKHSFPTDANGLKEFEALDRAVFVEARRLGLQNDLPGSDPKLNLAARFYGKTNLPGVPFRNRATGDPALDLIPLPRWWSDMRTLRLFAIAEAKTWTAPEADVAKNDEPLPQLTNNEEKILLYLYEQRVRIKGQDEIAAGTRLSRVNVGYCLKRLRDCGLVRHPADIERKGDPLTAEGRELAKHLKKSREKRPER